MTQVFFTAAELAEIAKSRGLASFPTTERGVQLFAKKSGWPGLPESLARKRVGRAGGGGTEYHFSLLPDTLQAAIAGQRAKTALMVRHDDEAERDRRQIAALKISALSPGHRAVMEARAEILTSIEGYAISRGEARAWGIARFLEAQAAFAARQEIEARRDAGDILTDREAASLARPLMLLAPEGFQLDPARVEKANDRARGEASISARSIQRWFKARDEQGVLALAPVPPKAPLPIPPGFAGFLKFYALPSKPSATDALGEYMKTVTDPTMALTIAQVRNILKVKLNSIERNVGREGLLTLRSRMPYVTRTTDDLWPTTVYTADGKTFDAEIADPVTRLPIRPEITTVLDAATRKVVGYSLSRKEAMITVAEALKNACASHGIPAIFYVDRGPGYKNKTFDGDHTGMMGRLGITKSHALPYNSQGKGLIERPNATIWDVLAKRLPTYIGSDMDKEAGKRVHKKTRAELKEFGQSNILPSWDAFVRLCNDRIGEYNDAEHTGLPRFDDPKTGKRRHMTPNEAWAAHVASGFEPVPLDADEADDLFRPYETRIVRRALVTWNTNEYFHDALEAYHEKEVMVGYDYHQADRVWVRDFDKETGQPGKLICVAIFAGNAQRYIPLTTQQAAEEKRAKGRKARLMRKVADVDAELNAPFLLEQQTVQPADFIDVSPAKPAAEPIALVVDNSPVAKTRAAYVCPDAELAMQVIADPSLLTPGRARLLQDLMSHRSGQELLRISGVDLTTLDDLLRSAA